MANYLYVGTSSSNLSAVKTPSSITWGRAMVSDDDAGRVKNNARMYVNKITDKVTLSLQWNGIKGADAAAILQAFDYEYFYVKYIDPMTNGWATKEFYHGDLSAPVSSYWVDGRLYENLAFNIIER